MSRTYRKTDLNSYPTGEDDPEDIRFTRKAMAALQPRLPPKPNYQWLPREHPIIDSDWDSDD